jgi:hypothetical protein
MKYAFFFLCFLSPTAIYDVRMTLDNEEDCRNIAKAIHDLLRPHLAVRGYDAEKVEKLLNDNTKWVKIA